MGPYILISILILITCFLLILVVLVQNSKGGGLASNFASSNQIMGVRRTTDFLEKTTWTLAVVLLVLSLVTVFTIPGTGSSSEAAKSEVSSQMQTEVPAGGYQAGPENNTSEQQTPAQQTPGQ